MYFVLRLHYLTYFGTKEGSRKNGEICITSRTRSEPIGDSSTRKGHRFLVTTEDKVVELSAQDYKSKLQWMAGGHFLDVSFASAPQTSNRETETVSLFVQQGPCLFQFALLSVLPATTQHCFLLAH